MRERALRILRSDLERRTLLWFRTVAATASRPQTRQRKRRTTALQRRWGANRDDNVAATRVVLKATGGGTHSRDRVSIWKGSEQIGGLVTGVDSKGVDGRDGAASLVDGEGETGLSPMANVKNRIGLCAGVVGWIGPFLRWTRSGGAGVDGDAKLRLMVGGGFRPTGGGSPPPMDKYLVMVEGGWGWAGTFGPWCASRPGLLGSVGSDPKGMGQA